jgi:hypothetical protein
VPEARPTLYVSVWRAKRTSTGINVLAAIELAKELGSTATVVTIAYDSGLKNTNGALFNGSRYNTS